MRLAKRYKRAVTSLMLLTALNSCAITRDCDPRADLGFFRTINCHASDAYRGRVTEDQQILLAEQRHNIDLQAENRRAGQTLNDTEKALNSAKTDLNDMEIKLRNMENNLQRSRRETLAPKSEISRYRTQIAQLKKNTAQGDPAIKEREKLKQELEKFVDDLEMGTLNGITEQKQVLFDIQKNNFPGIISTQYPLLSKLEQDSVWFDCEPNEQNCNLIPAQDYIARQHHQHRSESRMQDAILTDINQTYQRFKVYLSDQKQLADVFSQLIKQSQQNAIPIETKNKMLLELHYIVTRIEHKISRLNTLLDNWRSCAKLIKNFAVTKKVEDLNSTIDAARQDIKTYKEQLHAFSQAL